MTFIILTSYWQIRFLTCLLCPTDDSLRHSYWSVKKANNMIWLEAAQMKLSHDYLTLIPIYVLFVLLCPSRAHKLVYLSKLVRHTTDKCPDMSYFWGVLVSLKFCWRAHLQFFHKRCSFWFLLSMLKFSLLTWWNGIEVEKSSGVSWCMDFVSLCTYKWKMWKISAKRAHLRFSKCTHRKHSYLKESYYYFSRLKDLIFRKLTETHSRHFPSHRLFMMMNQLCQWNYAWKMKHTLHNQVTLKMKITFGPFEYKLLQSALNLNHVEIKVA